MTATPVHTMNMTRTGTATLAPSTLMKTNMHGFSKITANAVPITATAMNTKSQENNNQHIHALFCASNETERGVYHD